jgi:hypothetical protein
VVQAERRGQRVIARILRTLGELVGGAWALALLALRSGLRFRGAYWTWRMQTAFGRGMPASRAELLRGLIEYARWMHRVRRMG